jgi:hypothetical protein
MKYTGWCNVRMSLTSRAAGLAAVVGEPLRGLRLGQAGPLLPRPQVRLGRRVGQGAVQPDRWQLHNLAMGGNVIYAPPCIFPLGFS